MTVLSPRSKTQKNRQLPQIRVRSYRELTRGLHKRTIAIIGQKQTGKTTLLSKMLQFYPKPIICVDPVGRLAEYAKENDLDCYIIRTNEFNVDTWNAIQKILAKRQSLIVVINSVSQEEKVDFIDRLASALNLKQYSKFLLVIDEVHEIIPERSGLKAREFETLVRIGGNRNIGFIFTSQRPQSMDKEVLALADTWILFRVVHGRDLKALMDTLKPNLTNEDVAELESMLQTFETGQHIIFSYV